jgi:NAD(P)-dependent dehydrogenase (short-subunit alcohol dehydrogenase family)
MEYVADGIRVNTISPGVVDTPMHANDDHEFLKKLHPIAPINLQITLTQERIVYYARIQSLCRLPSQWASGAV